MRQLLATMTLSLAALSFDAGVAAAHGCHTNTQMDSRGWHRHSGYDCHRIRSHRIVGVRDGYDDDSGPRCVRQCQYIGLIKQCQTQCRH